MPRARAAGMGWRFGLFSPVRWLPLYTSVEFGVTFREYSSDERPVFVLLPEGPTRIGVVDVTRKSGSLQAYVTAAILSPWELYRFTPYGEALFG